jgi:dipeptidyl aminopeptidase/acylaminoacyl peptidase
MNINKSLIFLIILSFLFISCQKSDYKEVNKYTIEQFMNTTGIGGSSFSSDESKILYTADASGIFNSYTIPISGGEPTQITHSDSNSIFSISFFPHDDRILFRADKNGNEIYHIYLLNEDGTIQDLTPGENARSTFYGWSFDDKSFYYGNNKRDARFMDIYEMEIESFESNLLFQNDVGYYVGDFSNDKKFLAFVKIITDHNSDIYLYNIETSSIEHITPHEGDINFDPVTFSVDSKSLYYLTNENSEFTYLKKYDFESEIHEIVAEADWNIMYAYLSKSGKYRVMGINNDAKTEIQVLETDRNKLVKLPQLPDANITSVNISDSENLMTFYVSSSKSPNNLYIYNFDTKKHQKLTDSMNPEIIESDLVDGKVIRFKSFDDLEIPAILYKPHDIKSGEKIPALVMVHGGPGGQARIGYRETTQYLVNHGYVVLDINNRGSSGYGKTFYKLDDLKHGEDDLMDCVIAKDFLYSTGYVDSNKIGIIGGSYGGYMVLAALTFQPNEFDVGVDLFGISNWVRTLESIPPWWEAYKEALYIEMGNPETQKDYLYSISPLFHYENIERPLMVLQGANDPRVLKVESDEIVEAVKAKGVPVEYVVFDDEGHGFYKKENRIASNKAILEFLETYLK